MPSSRATATKRQQVPGELAGFKTGLKLKATTGLRRTKAYDDGPDQDGQYVTAVSYEQYVEQESLADAAAGRGEQGGGSLANASEAHDDAVTGRGWVQSRSVSDANGRGSMRGGRCVESYLVRAGDCGTDAGVGQHTAAEKSLEICLTGATVKTKRPVIAAGKPKRRKAVAPRLLNSTGAGLASAGTAWQRAIDRAQVRRSKGAQTSAWSSRDGLALGQAQANWEGHGGEQTHRRWRETPAAAERLQFVMRSTRCRRR
jgi:hypothetical protein